MATRIATLRERDVEALDRTPEMSENSSQIRAAEVGVNRAISKFSMLARDAISGISGMKTEKDREEESELWARELDFGLDRTVLYLRMELEVNMSRMLPHILLFVICYLLFIATQQLGFDPKSRAQSQDRLRRHLSLPDSLTTVDDAATLQTFLETSFLQNLPAIEPFNPYFWCPENSSFRINNDRAWCQVDMGAEKNALWGAGYSAIYNLGPTYEKAPPDFFTLPPNSTNSSRRLTGAPLCPTASRPGPCEQALSIRLFSPSTEQPKKGTGPVPVNATKGVIGATIRGTLLVAASFQEGGSPFSTWPVDMCDGHTSPSSGWYMYHTLPACFLRELWLPTASRADWWEQENPAAFWPPSAEPSPVLGYALDGFKIYGPYGSDGQVVKVKDLDECHGRFEEMPGGGSEYRYRWTLEPPFLPTCFRGPPASISLASRATVHCKPAPARGLQATPPPGRPWALQVYGCPDHAALSGEAAAPVAEAAARKLKGLQVNISDILKPYNTQIDPSTSPSAYSRNHPYIMIMSKVGDPMICQTRWKKGPCTSKLANAFNVMPTLNTSLPPYDAPKNDDIYRCRTSEHDDQPHLGYTPFYRPGSAPLYCMILTWDAVPAMKELEWVDDLTDALQVFLIIFHPNTDILSVLELDFSIPNTGGIIPAFKLISQTVMPTNLLEIWLPVCTLWIFMSIFRLQVDFWSRFVKGGSVKVFLVDSALSIMFIGFGVYSMVRQSTSHPVVTEILDLVSAFTSMNALTGQLELQSVVEKFFVVIDATQLEASKDDLLHTLGYTMVILGLARLIAYMTVHPRIELISRTLTEGADELFHFFIVFIMCFVLVAWLGYWSFGSDQELFQTFQQAIYTCFQWLVSAWAFDNVMPPGPLEIAWQVFFVFLVFFVSVNVLLAIIVEAFLYVKKQVDDNPSEMNVVMDVLAVITGSVMQMLYDWPRREQLFRFLETTTQIKVPVSARELQRNPFVRFPSLLSAKSFMWFYYQMLGEVILSKSGQDYLTQLRSKKKLTRFIRRAFRLTWEDLAFLTTAVVRLQRKWRQVRARKELLKMKKARDRKVATQLETKGITTPSAGAVGYLALPTLALKPSEVRDWALSLGLEREVAEKFVSQDIDGTALLTLVDSDLERLGMLQMGPRKRFMLAIGQLVRVTSSLSRDVSKGRGDLARELTAISRVRSFPILYTEETDVGEELLPLKPRRLQTKSAA